jgi:succinate-semialdehyde dehydrogenase/glutarate-semialdehyde dehydrogenase
MYQSISPFNQSILKKVDFDELPDLHQLSVYQKAWAAIQIQERGVYLRKIADLIIERKKDFAELITAEMGKPLRESIYELDKTITAFDYYISNAPAFLQDKYVATSASKSYVTYAPLGILLSVMPWNFPFWQVFRFAVPSLMAGNTTILKHSPNVPQCAAAIAQLFQDADVPAGLLTNLFLSNEQVAQLISDDHIAGVSFTGSDATGSIIAKQAGQHIKKCVVELGGNDPFIILNDADIETAVAGAIKSRGINSGQSCNGAKRFILLPNIYESFVEKLKYSILKLKVGNPLDESTDVGPLARVDLKEKVNRQIEQSITQGAKAFRQPLPENTTANFVMPTLLTDVKPGVCAFEEEIFGPVWSVIKAKNEGEALALANQSQYGLGASIWTKDIEKASKMASMLESGNVFINSIVKSDARLPFGGVKKSGFGRELSEYGLKEFVNIKTVFIQ